MPLFYFIVFLFLFLFLFIFFKTIASPFLKHNISFSFFSSKHIDTKQRVSNSNLSSPAISPRSDQGKRTKGRRKSSQNEGAQGTRR